MLIPSQIILTYVRPSFWLPGLELIWGMITGLMALTHSAKQVYILRVFLGLCESSAWPVSSLLKHPWMLRLTRSGHDHTVYALVHTNGAGQKNGLLPLLPGYR